MQCSLLAYTIYRNMIWNKSPEGGFRNLNPAFFEWTDYSVKYQDDTALHHEERKTTKQKKEKLKKFKFSSQTIGLI